ncbi:MAG: glycosyltransferase family 4 protein [Flavobacterium sp.]|nr:glycosyltransferase family 4 protein [Flavobacterium sp.]
MVKVILISQFSLPYQQIGSWTTLYGNYLSDDHQIDIIVCPEPEVKYANVKYSYVEKDLSTAISRRLFGYTYLEYTRALKKVIKNDEKYIIQVVDNHGMVPFISEFLKKNGLRTNCKIQFFYHGFSPLYNNYHGDKFFAHIDEIVLLTKASYRSFIRYYNSLPCNVSILANGIDTSKFTTVDQSQKNKHKSELGLSGKTVFIWCSRNRRKKGLELILDAWKHVYPKHPEIALLVIGGNCKNPINGVKFIGEIDNDSLPYYYQTADVYLFPTLCHEGFGMSLIEAMHCGCYSIASALGGVPEVLENGKLGTLVANPHFVTEWVAAITEYLQNPKLAPMLSSEIYSTKSWNNGMNEIISSVKLTLEK